MLEGNYAETLSALLANVPGGVRLPDSWFEPAGGIISSPPAMYDRRRFPRARFRSEAICEIIPSLPAIQRSHGFCKVYTLDISRCGFGFLAALQLFPGEQIVLWTQSGKFRCKVARCTKRNDKCFEIGAVFQGQ